MSAVRFAGRRCPKMTENRNCTNHSRNYENKKTAFANHHLEPRRGLGSMYINHDGAGRPNLGASLRCPAHGNDGANAVAVDSAGTWPSPGLPEREWDYDFYTAKYAADGTLLWEHRYDGTNTLMTSLPPWPSIVPGTWP